MSRKTVNLLTAGVILAGAFHLGTPTMALASAAAAKCTVKITSADGTVRETTIEASTCTLNVVDGTCKCS